MAPFPDPPRTPEGQDSALDSRQKAEDAGAGPHHINARHLLYPNSSVTRFPVPDEKVPWEVLVSGLGVRGWTGPGLLTCTGRVELYTPL